MKRSDSDKLVYFALPIALTITIAFLPTKSLLAYLGKISFYLFTVTLFIKPLSILTRNKILIKLIAFRRELGLSTFYFFMAHGFGFIYLYNLNIFKTLLRFNALSWGLMAGIILILMAATSNDFAVTLLKRNWKRLHRLAYPAYFLVLMHYSLGAGGMSKLYLFGGAYLVLKIAQYIKTKTI